MGLAARGQRAMDGRISAIQDPAERRRLRTQSLSIAVRAALLAAAGTACLALPYR